METPHTICQRLGRKRLASSLGVKPAALSNAISAGQFPSRWFRVVKELCGAQGIECPQDIFAFAQMVDPDAKQDQPQEDEGAK